MHLADAFIQSDLHCIQVTVLKIFISSYINKGDSTKGLANQTIYECYWNLDADTEATSSCYMWTILSCGVGLTRTSL